MYLTRGLIFVSMYTDYNKQILILWKGNLIVKKVFLNTMW